MAKVLSLIDRLQDAKREQMRLGRMRQTTDVRRKLQEVKRLKAKINREIAAIARKIGTPSGAKWPEEIIIKIQKTINREGWAEKIIEARFAGESVYREGPRWRPLTASTIRQRVRQGFGAGPILQRTGRLRRDAIRSVKDSLNVGTKGGLKGEWRLNKMRTSYATYVHRHRPFLLPPSGRELRPVRKRVQELAAQLVKESFGA